MVVDSQPARSSSRGGPDRAGRGACRPGPARPGHCLVNFIFGGGIRGNDDIAAIQAVDQELRAFEFLLLLSP
jgi:hypothetical protein